MESISAAFMNYFDNLVFKHKDPNGHSKDILQLPSIKNRFKVSVGLVYYARENQILDEVSTDRDRSEADYQRVRGAINFLQLIQLAITILYSSRTIFDNIEELKNIKQQTYSYTKEHFDVLFEPILDGMGQDSPDLDTEVIFQLIDCVSKMLKYQQVFHPTNNEIFDTCYDSVIKVSPTLPENLTTVWTVLINLVTVHRNHSIGKSIPKFLKKFNNEMKQSDLNPENVNNSFRAIKTLKMIDICSDITKDASFDEL
jgi:hypothetical protein